MSGTTQGLDTRSEQASYRIVPDMDGSIAKWVCDGLGESTSWIGQNATMGVLLNQKLIAGVIFNDIRPNVDAWLTIYSTDKRWCIKRVLKCVFGLVFNEMKCRRASVLVSKDNSKSLDMCKRLGFKIEGLLRQYRDNGDDCYVMGMLNEECKWR